MAAYVIESNNFNGEFLFSGLFEEFLTRYILLKTHHFCKLSHANYGKVIFVWLIGCSFHSNGWISESNIVIKWIKLYLHGLVLF